jgi:hypothetical protein
MATRRQQRRRRNALGSDIVEGAAIGAGIAIVGPIVFAVAAVTLIAIGLSASRA